jgi:uncharacterized lipoprotein YajG
MPRTKLKWRSKMTQTSSRSRNFKASLLLLALPLLLTGCQSLPSVAVCRSPKEMPELVKQPVPTESQLDAMKKRIDDFETSSSQVEP